MFHESHRTIYQALEEMEELLKTEARLSNHVALITGASRNWSIALELATLGANVVVNYASSSAAAEQVVVANRWGGSAIALS